MVSNRGYTTATKVRDAMASQIHTSFSDADIENCINRIEGIIDTKLKVGAGTGSTATFTWTTGDAPQWVLEGAATYGSALQLCGASAASWNTLEQLVNAQNTFAYLYKLFMDLIDAEDFGDKIIEEA